MSQDDLYNLEFLSLVAKITQEIYNHTSLNDKTLAEFVIDLHDQSKTLVDFKANLKQAGADFPESFVENIDRLVLTLHPKHKKRSSTEEMGSSSPMATTHWKRKTNRNVCSPVSQWPTRSGNLPCPRTS
jgi:ATP-dependent RNA helicase DHX8/PRP22